jgi:hypothetical protein
LSVTIHFSVQPAQTDKPTILNRFNRLKILMS